MNDGMTREEFIAYAHEYLFGEGSEVLFELIAEYNSEVSMFGDAGPGVGLVLWAAISEYNRIGERWSELTGRPFQRATMMAPR